MTPKPGATRIAVLVAQHPAINHAVILREIRELRKFLDIRTASIRGPDRPSAELSDEERNEAANTFYVKQQGLLAVLGALLPTFLFRPFRFLGGMGYALSLAGLRVRKSLKNLAYFAEAVVLGHWMEKNHLIHLHVHYSSTVGLLLARVFPVELSISFHGPDEFKDPVGFWLREKIEACTFVRAISQYAREQLMKTCAAEQWSKIEVAYMGVDSGILSPQKFRERPDPLEIICVGRLVPVKGQKVLIAAIEQLVRDGRNVLLHLVGGGPDRESLEREAASRGIQRNVTFHGFTPQDKLNELYARADVFALASFAEGLPGVLMEAMAMQLPCVSTSITGVPELIRDGTDGLLVPPGNETAMAGAIARLMDNPQLRQHLGSNARRRITEDFELGKNAHYMASIFERRVGSGPVTRGLAGGENLSKS
ncbi:MAG TPA: glycosyltransferase family 4 protein [Terriglobales bacterium]|nr:glycosyltransferase family 4 protein [Terriglobales bacterium]